MVRLVVSHMSFTHRLSDSELLEDTDIDFYGQPDIQFHVNTGREWESKKTVSYDDNGNKVEKQTINTKPCPTIDVYDMEGGIEVLVYLPIGKPIVIDWFTVEDDYEQFFTSFINGLEKGYDGISEVTSFGVESGNTKLGDMVSDAIETGTPDSVTVPNPVGV